MSRDLMSGHYRRAAYSYYLNFSILNTFYHDKLHEILIYCAKIIKGIIHEYAIIWVISLELCKSCSKIHLYQANPMIQPI
jgi:hypothetical protein